MNEKFWAQVEETFFEAVELPKEARTTFLNQVCAEWPEIQREVESLLQHEAAAKQLNPSAVVAAAAELFTEDESGLIGTVVADKYLIRSCLGTGGSGEVYLADHIALDTPFALKRPKTPLGSDPQYRKRFVQEARRAVLLKHDNVARVHDVIDVGEDVFIVMEYVEGTTLRTRLDDRGRPFTTDEFLPIATQCAAALAAAHEKHLVHLDVKPGNIMLTPAGQVKVCDFGVARRLSADTGGDTTTSKADWTFAGTPAYMAPEVILSHQFDERADLFSLGTVFYEMLTGRNPFTADTVVATTARVVSDNPPPISTLNPDVDPKLERIIARMLCKDPNERYATATDVVNDLTAVRRSRNRYRDVAESIREAFAESRWMKAAAIIVSLVVIAAPFAGIYWNRLERWIDGAALPERRIEAVLPFQLIGNSRDERLYSEGVSEILTGKLAQLTNVPNLQVVPSSEIRSRKIDNPEKARAEFGATIVLAGAFQFSGDQVRVSYSLIDAVHHRGLRSGSKTFLLADPFTLQDAAIRDILSMLEIQFPPTAQETLQVFGTPNPKAFFLYTQGRGALSNYYDRENVDTAINLFTQAVELDPQYAAGFAALGRTYWQKFSFTKQPAWLDQGLNACEKAVSLDRPLSDGHVCLGLLHESKGDNELAVEDYQRAITYSAGASDDALRGLGSVLEELHRYEDAEKAYLKAIELRPQYWASQSWIAVFYNRDHKYSKAIEHFYKALALSPDNAQVYYSLALALLNDGQYDNAIRSIQKSIELRPYVAEPYNNLGLTYLRTRRYNDAIAPLEKAASIGNNYGMRGNLARIYWLTGQKEKARQNYQLGIEQGEKLILLNPRDHAAHLLVGRYYAMLDKKTEALSHIELALTLHPDDPHYLTIAATAYVQLGDRNNALSLLEQAVRLGYTTVQIQGEPELDVLKAEPRFIALMSSNPQRR
ncbi:MAG: hypothetical protein DMG17_28985 [Acidobacteria bacterium]|nr:MAG: hypothetical protein DMG17_28985 [Acidobacteriota bacterium]